MKAALMLAAAMSALGVGSVGRVTRGMTPPRVLDPEKRNAKRSERVQRGVERHRKFLQSRLRPGQWISHDLKIMDSDGLGGSREVV